jgi:hypothetical protein
VRLLTGGGEQALRLHPGGKRLGETPPQLCMPFTSLPNELNRESHPFAVDVSGDSGEVRSLTLTLTLTPTQTLTLTLTLTL